MRAKDVMTERPCTAQTTTTLYDAMHAMWEQGFRHLPVVDDGSLVGMLSERDLRGESLSLLDDPANARAWLRQAVAARMVGDVLSVDPETDLSEVIDLLLENHVGALPVVDAVDGEVVGIVSYVDVLRALRDSLAES